MEIRGLIRWIGLNNGRATRLAEPTCQGFRISRLGRWRFMFVSALIRRAVPVSEDDAGFDDDPADGGVGVAFIGAFSFDEHGAALGGEGDAAGGEIDD